MFRRTRWTLASLLVLGLLVAVALPVRGEDRPAPSPVPPEAERFPCLPTGLALGVVSQDGLIADILTEPRLDAAADAERIIVLPGPGTAGACAEFQGFWGPGARGTLVSELTVWPRDAASISNGPLGRDGFKDERTGPAIHRQALKAGVKFDKPGRYPLVAVLRVRAERPASAANRMESIEDAIRVPFVVQVLDRPQPQPLGAIEGFVYNALTGEPLAGAVVMATSQRPLSAAPPRDRQPILEPRPNGGAELDQAMAPGGTGYRVVTDEKGHYRIPLPAGKYIVAAQARGFALQYFAGKETPEEADPVTVKAQETTSDVNFKLRPLDEPPPPVFGVIRGQVVGQGAGPLAGARVVAQPVRATEPPRIRPLEAGVDQSADPGLGANLSAVTDEHGRYEIKVPLGHYVVMAKAEGYLPQWFKGADTVDKATIVRITREQPEAENVNFELKKAESPVLTGISGKVTRLTASRAEPQPVPGALVIVARRITDPSTGAQRFEVVAKGETNREGAYLIPTRPGEYVVGVVLARPDRDNVRDGRIWWFAGTLKLEEATVVVVADGVVTEGIDFELPPVSALP